MRYKIVIFAVVMFAVLSVGLELTYRFHYFFIEQNQMFLFTGDYFWAALARPGGLAGWAGEFFVQFFSLPLAGSTITALLLTAAGVMTALLSRRMAPVSLWLLWALPVVGLLCAHFDFNWFYQGTVAFLVALAALGFYVGQRRFGVRLAWGAVLVPLLFWLCGPVAMLFAVSAAVWEAAAGSRRWYLSTALVIEAVACGWIAVRWALVGDWGTAVTPRAYYTPLLEPGAAIWLAWVSVPVVIVASRMCRGLRVQVNSRKQKAILNVVQIVVLAGVVWAGVENCIDRKSYHLKRLDHYSRTGQWDEIVETSRGAVSNYMYLNMLNGALAGKGVLADEMFRYDQRGVEGLVLPWNQQLMPAVIRSDIFFRAGNVAIAQEMAFEANLSTGGGGGGGGSPRMMQRLVETNLIYGAWPVAEKYLDRLSRTLFYREWAEGRRRFLYDEAAVEADPVLGPKRRSLPAVSRLSRTPLEDLVLVARQNPRNKTAVEYLGAMILLAKDLERFAGFVEEYYGEGALPRAFQEAVVAIWETDTGMWARYRVDAGVIERFERFRKRFMDGRAQQGLANRMRGEYGDTFWFYLMFK